MLSAVHRGPASLEQRLGDGLELHVGRPLVDRADLGVPIELLHRVLTGKPVSPVKVDGSFPASRVGGPSSERLCMFAEPATSSQP